MRAIFHYPPAMIHRGPRPHRALREAIPIAKARGMIQVTLAGPERIFDNRWVHTNPEEEKTAGLRHCDHLEGAGCVYPCHVRAKNSRGDYGTCGILQGRDRFAQGHRPGPGHNSRALAPVQARDVAVLPCHAEYAGRDRPRGETDCFGTDGYVNGQGYSRRKGFPPF